MIEKRRRVIVDTNVLVSAVILPESVTSRAVDRVMATSDLLLSAALIAELDQVFRRPKLDRYTALDTRLSYLWSVTELGKPVSVSSLVHECRDAKDNMLLALALDGQADLILTGDGDLLSLHPWRGVAILSPAEYLALTR